MKTAIIVHGKPEKDEYYSPEGDSQSNCHWIPWLQKQLIVHGILAQTPEMSTPYEPVYEEWKATFEQFAIDEDTILVGHSCGAGFLVRWLSEEKVAVGKVVLVAPWIDPSKEMGTNFFDFTIDEEIVARTKNITIMYSTNDDEDVLATVSLLKEKLPTATVHTFTDKGHFTLGDMGTREFPELLSIIR